jgi:hypothetical protein
VRLVHRIRRFQQGKRGLTEFEYVALLALVIIACLAAIALLGARVVVPLGD